MSLKNPKKILSEKIATEKNQKKIRRKYQQEKLRKNLFTRMAFYGKTFLQAGSFMMIFFKALNAATNKQKPNFYKS